MTVSFVLWALSEQMGVDVVQIETGNGVFSIPSIELSPYSYRRKAGFKPDAFHMPLCFLAAIITALTVVPWLPWWSTRFSLRTMLIVTAVVAVVLGLVVWMVRNWAATNKSASAAVECPEAWEPT